VDSTIAPIREADGSLIGSVAVSRDVTEQKQAERAPATARPPEPSWDTAADGIVIFDEDGSSSRQTWRRCHLRPSTDG
jgi:hypothetical protein